MRNLSFVRQCIADNADITHWRIDGQSGDDGHVDGRIIRRKLPPSSPLCPSIRKCLISALSFNTLTDKAEIAHWRIDGQSGDDRGILLCMIRPSAWPRSLSRWVFKNKKNLSNQCYVKCRELIIIITKSKILRLCIKIKDFSSNCRDPVYIILYLYGNCEYLCL